MPFLKNYVVGEAQKDNANNNSLSPFYLECLRTLAYEEEVKVIIVDSKPALTATIRSFKQVKMNAFQFTNNAKRCVAQFQEQAKLRLPDLGVNNLITIFLDPMTKSYSWNLCRGKHLEAKKEISVLYRDMYVALTKDEDT